MVFTKFNLFIEKICWVIGWKPNNYLDSQSAMHSGDLIFWFLWKSDNFYTALHKFPNTCHMRNVLSNLIKPVHMFIKGT